MFNLTGKKYFLVGNCTFTSEDLVKLPNQDVDFIKVNLPIGFKQATGKKIYQTLWMHSYLCRTF
jgi:hypothetical protein